MQTLGTIPETVIQQAVDILVREAAPNRVILFGSYARGEAHAESDLDFLVVLDRPFDKLAEMNRLRTALRPLSIPADVLVADEAYLASSWADFPGTYLFDALREGKVMYAVDRTSAPALAKSP
jgi:predicted nucleotidyltransferase